ncbi:MAG: lipopolysaccharide biosynthesis protein [Brachymonas sp.]|nr:lipopolysaccharide biosynthesis protein [Brachymonas sp.]
MRNILVMLTGTSLAQLLSILISPLLTRIYSPDTFGLFANFLAVHAIIGSVAALRYEIAIMLPRSQKRALNVMLLACGITLGVALLAAIVFMLGNSIIANLVDKPEMEPWLFWLPLSIAAMGLYQTFSYWHNRQRCFALLAQNRFWQSLTTSASQLILALLGLRLGLLWGYLFGLMASTVFLASDIAKNQWRNFRYVQRRTLHLMARQYVRFPLYDVPSVLLGVGANQIPSILFSVMFSPAVAGVFYLTQRVLQAPITLISSSVVEVFKEHAAHEYRTLGHARSAFRKTLLLLIMVSLPPAIVLYFLIVPLFGWVFGSQWTSAGVYAQIMLPALFIRFVASPLSFMFYIAERQRLNLMGMAVLAFGTWGMFHVYDSPETILRGINWLYFVVYFSYLAISAKLAGYFHGPRSTRP